MTQPILYLPEEVLAGLDISVDETVAAIEALFHGQAAGSVYSAPKSAIATPDGRLLMTTLAASDEPAIMSVKSLILNGRNSERGLPSINALITLLDSRSGAPLAIVDGNWITAVRTAGLSALAAKRLARPDARTASFIGCGVQAERHLRTFATLFPLRQVQAFGRGRRKIDAFCAVAQTLGLQTVVCDSAEAAVRAGDIVISTVTTAPPQPPFLDARWLQPGAFLASVDRGAPWRPETLAAIDRIVIDDIAQEATMAEKMVDPGRVDGDLSGLALGDGLARTNDRDIAAFVFRAHPHGDLALAALALKKATAARRGRPLDPS